MKGSRGHAARSRQGARLDRDDNLVAHHERWMAEHEAMLRKYQENRLELQEEMKLT